MIVEQCCAQVSDLSLLLDHAVLFLMFRILQLTFVAGLLDLLHCIEIKGDNGL